MIRTSILTAVGALGIVMVGTACGTDSATTPSTDTEPTTSLGTRTTPLGEILTDTTGMTLYRFDDDMPGMSMCIDACAAAWPPLPGPQAVAEHVSGSLGTITRPDGTIQATYDGQPLYTFAEDDAPGDTLGDGAKNKWHVIVFEHQQ